MIQFGSTLKAAREAKGLTIAQIAEATRMMSSMVQDLENENFTKIAAPIYGRGFVKLYCEAVGIDPKPLVAEFMDIFSGNRDLNIHERPVAEPTPQPQAAPLPAQVPEPPAAEPLPVPAAESPLPAAQPAPNVQPGLFDPPAPPPPPICEPESSMVPDKPQRPATEPVVEKPQRIVNYTPVNPVREFENSLPRLSPAIWRWAVIAVIAVVLLWFIGLGIRALYRATAPGEASPEATAAAEVLRTDATAVKQPVAADTAKPQAPRTPQDIPQLYIN